jgi:hypothetical protein
LQVKVAGSEEQDIMGKGQPPDRLAAIDDESSLSPEESLGLVEAEGTKAARSLYVHPAPILAA